MYRTMKRRRIVINISGMYYETYAETLARFPRTLLGSFKSRSYYYNAKREEYYFDRNRLVFDAVLFYYQSGGILACPPGVTEDIFAEELRFFQIKDSRDLNNRGEDIDNARRFIAGDELPIPRRQFQAMVWELFYNPSSSWYAGIIEIISVTALLCIVVLSCIETVPSVKEDLKNKNSSSLAQYFDMTNYVCHGWFTFEYTMRLSSAADKIRYLKTFDSLVDLCAVLPFYIQLLVSKDNTIMKLAVLRILRILRVARVLKITRHFRGMRALTYTLYASWYELQNFLTVAMLFMTVISSITFWFEREEPGTLIRSIPDALWWSINTFTTVGYGDVYPITLEGKLLGALCGLVGIVFLGLPVYSLVNNFMTFWDAMKDMDPKDHLVTNLKKSIRRLSRLRHLLDGTS